MKKTSQVKKVIVLERVGGLVQTMRTGSKAATSGGMNWCASRAPSAMPSRWMPTDTLFVLYTSGSTGKPKGIIHSTGGYLLGCYVSSKYVFDLKEDDIYWCTADVGWITGHSYIVYGPLANGTTTLMYEGAPEPSGLQPILVDHRASQGDDFLHRADRHSRVHARGRELVDRHDLRALRLLGTVGEPINPKRGCGITTWSGTPGARSWTLGGRRKPA